MINISKLPDDVIYIIQSYTIFKPKTKQELINTVRLYFDNNDKCMKIYDDISLWDTSLITDMSNLFCYYKYFNEYTFYFFRAQYFNQNICNWNISNVIDMSYIFLK